MKQPAMMDEPIGDRLRDLLMCEQEREQHCVGDDVEQHGAHAGGGKEHARDGREGQIAVDVDRDDEGIDRAYGGGLCRREDAAIDAAHDDHNQGQAPDAIQKRRQPL
jgi:hypothetical protein